MARTAASAPYVPSHRGVRWCTTCCAIYRSDFARCPLDGGELAIAITDPMIGKTLTGHYTIEDLIGEGAMGRVYRAHHARLVHKRYALKVMLGDLAARSAMRSRFRLEAEAVSKLSHPNIVGIADFGCTPEGLMYLVMELVDGGTLAQLVRGCPLAPARAIRIARQLGEALAHAHERGVVHRDLKPENVLVVGEGSEEVARIADFGLAISTGPDDVRLTTSGVVCTPAYAAPEQLLGHAIDHRCDLYALGVTMYEMVTGMLPFAGDKHDIAFGKVGQAAPPVLARAPGVPARLAALVERLLERDPRARIGSAEEVMRMLDEVAAARSVAVAPLFVAPRVVEIAPTDRVEPVRPAKRVRAGWATAMIAAAVCGAAGNDQRRVVRTVSASTSKRLVASVSDPGIPKVRRSPTPTPTRSTAPSETRTARVVDLDVSGSLPTSVVRRAIDRMLPAVQRCGRGSATIAFSIDELQRPTAIRVAGDRSGCILAALGRLRTDAAPDVGDAQVAARLAY